MSIKISQTRQTFTKTNLCAGKKACVLPDQHEFCSFGSLHIDIQG